MQVAQDNFDIEMKDDAMRREAPIDHFIPPSTSLKKSKTEKEKPHAKLKGFEIEKWVEKDLSDTSSQKHYRTSLVSEEHNRVLDIADGSNKDTAKSKELFTRNSDSLHINERQHRKFPFKTKYRPSRRSEFQ